ncbi:phenol hydroxylase subunit P4 [Azospirillum agricola]|uniref:phenol hydroxylase subunit P4 n=1 Tax=Azospirillum agricola TaxID=1720247 RepID=UPI000A0F153C|nr:phenol hydroxylase subunit P4 [Azospirillum agricola]MBP2227917.1 phenol hydroxylase P4 protein [Azospirillum agricola]SMH46446.1 phenol 2-monooxygenase P4 subunit [Azospirillum lipoferum]
MAVVALDEHYADKIEIRDRVENFHGNIVVYLHWEEHLSFCSAVAFPFPPAMPFGALVKDILPATYGAHPDFAAIDWDAVRWTVDGRETAPDPARSLAENGVGHKSLLRFRTPGLHGYRGTRS